MDRTEEKSSLKTQWWRFHKQHPEVFERFRQIAFDLISNGHKHYSSDGILHVVRFELNRQIKDPGSQYKINNNWTPYYARYFIWMYPEYENFFETRELISQSKTLQKI